MAQLHEVLAVEGDLSTVATKMIQEAIITFTKKPETYRGQTRTLTMFESSREGEGVTEYKTVADTVPAKLLYVSKAVESHWNVVAEKEEANQRAIADLVVEGKVLATALPATYLLGLETRMKSIRELIEATPTLDPSLTWTRDETAGVDIFRAQDKVAMRTEKTVKHKILVEPTDKHPAQVEKWNEDVPVGRIETVNYSGMISPARKAVLLSRVDAIIRGTKKARQRANTVEVKNADVASAIFGYILAD
jgi:hypothetical protein